MITVFRSIEAVVIVAIEIPSHRINHIRNKQPSMLRLRSSAIELTTAEIHSDPSVLAIFFQSIEATVDVAIVQALSTNHSNNQSTS